MTSFAIAIPQAVEGGQFDPKATQAFLRRAEELGFESAWTQEQIIGDMPELGPLETMAYAAACTERMRLGCAVLISSLHSPLHLAKSLSTLDQLSDGRLEVGLAPGGGFRMFGAFGVDRASFVARFNEGLALMRRLWTEDRVDHDGRFFRLTGVAMEPKPVQQPAPPIWFGGNAPGALRRAVAQGNGFFGAGSQTTAAFAEQVAFVRAALDDAGRDPAGFRFAKRVYLTVDDDPARARRHMGEGLHRLYDYFGLPDLTSVAVTGPPAAIVEGVQEVIDAGAELVLLNPMFDDAEQLERLAAEVVPELS